MVVDDAFSSALRKAFSAVGESHELGRFGATRW